MILGIRRHENIAPSSPTAVTGLGVRDFPASESHRVSDWFQTIPTHVSLSQTPRELASRPTHPRLQWPPSLLEFLSELRSQPSFQPHWPLKQMDSCQGLLL